MRAADADRIAAIVNEAVEDGTATFEPGPKSGGDVAGWIAQLLPFVVAEEDAQVIGFARLSKDQDCCALSGIAEQSVYVARAARGHGVGRRLLDELAAQAEQVGFYKQRQPGQPDGKWSDCAPVESVFGRAA